MCSFSIANHLIPPFIGECCPSRTQVVWNWAINSEKKPMDLLYTLLLLTHFWVQTFDCYLSLALFSGHSQILSRSCGEKSVLSCEIKSGSGLGMRLTFHYSQLQACWLQLYTFIFCHLTTRSSATCISNWTLKWSVCYSHEIDSSDSTCNQYCVLQVPYVPQVAYTTSPNGKQLACSILLSPDFRTCCKPIVC